jgi:drug/metabolite transporter (DMT)-like permease
MTKVLSTSEGTHRGTFTALDWVLFLSIGLIWGSSFILIATALEEFEPGLITWLRVAAGSAVLWLLRASRVRIHREDVPRLVAVSILWVALPFTLFPLAQQHVTSAVTGMLNGGVPIVTAAIATLLLRRLPGKIQIVGLALGFAGVAAIALSTAGEGSSQALGVAMLLLAVLCYGTAINLATPLQQTYGSLPAMAWMLALASVWTAPFGLASIGGSGFAWGALLAVLALGVLGTGLAFVLMGRLIGRVGSTRGSFVTYLIPVVALILGVSIRDEQVAAAAIVGIAMVLGGALLASRADRGHVADVAEVAPAVEA